MRRGDIDAVRRLNPSRLVMTGNPFVNAGVFYDSHHSLRELYETVQISAFETPNVKKGRTVVPGMITVEDIADRKEEWGEESPLFIGSVHGKFPDNLEGVTVPLWAATEAAKREMTPDGPVVVGCDVARFGHDKTVVIRRQGPVARIVWRVRGKDTMNIAGYLKAYCTENEVETLVVDDTGVGGGVVDRLKEERLSRTRIVPFIAAARPEDETYFANRLAEVWWMMRNSYLTEELDTDDDPSLIGQVSSRTYSYRGDGRISPNPPKDTDGRREESGRGVRELRGK